MASTPLFTQVPQNITIATAAGSGNVNRWTYTVPAGKRAIVRHVTGTIFVSAAAANTTIIIISATLNGVNVQVMRLGNAAVIAGELDQQNMTQIEMYGGDTLTGNTVNNSAVVVTMNLGAVIEEYG